MKKYTISPVTGYCEDENLFYTKMGVQAKKMPLHYTVWGKTERESRERAERLGRILSGNSSKKDLTGIPNSLFFYAEIYPIFSKEFLFGHEYTEFAEQVQESFVLSPEQWGIVLNEWETKETILSNPIS